MQSVTQATGTNHSIGDTATFIDYSWTTCSK